MKLKDYMKKHKLTYNQFERLFSYPKGSIASAIKRKWNVVELMDGLKLITLTKKEIILRVNQKPTKLIKSLIGEKMMPLRELIKRKNMYVNQFADLYNCKRINVSNWCCKGYKAQEFEDYVQILIPEKKQKAQAFKIFKYRAPEMVRGSKRPIIKKIKKIDLSHLSCSLPISHIKNDWLNDGISSHE